MTPPDYLLIGHITADLKGTDRVLGGTVSYSAVVAHALGQRVAVLTSAKANEPLLSELAPYAQVMNLVAPETTTFENVYYGAERLQTLHAHAQRLDYGHVPSAWANAPLVHVAPVADEVMPQLLTRFPQSTVMLTPQGLLRQWGIDGRVRFKRWFDPSVLQAVTVAVFSQQDIAEHPELEAQFAQVVPHVFVTDGANGGVYYANGIAHPYRAYPVEEIDPTGAGDVFATSLLASLPLVGYQWRKALQVAIRLSALAVTQIGTHAPTPQAIAEAVQTAT